MNGLTPDPCEAGQPTSERVTTISPPGEVRVGLAGRRFMERDTDTDGIGHVRFSVLGWRWSDLL